MAKFTLFEKAVEMIYKTLGKPKESYNSLQQTGVSFLGGYIAGIGSAAVSHPAGKWFYLSLEYLKDLMSRRCYGLQAE
jgi:hypothetical protein